MNFTGLVLIEYIIIKVSLGQKEQFTSTFSRIINTVTWLGLLTFFVFSVLVKSKWTSS